MWNLQRLLSVYQSPDDGAGGGGSAGGNGTADHNAAPAGAGNLVADAGTKPNTTPNDGGGNAAPAAGDAGKETPAPAPAAADKVAVEDAKKYLIDKKGAKAEDLAKLDEAGLRKLYGESLPLTYTDFKAPEGVNLDEKLLPELKSVFAEAKLSQDQAQMLIDKFGGKLVYVDNLQALQDAPYKLWNDTQAQWQGKAKADPEYGGAKFEATMSTIASGIDMFFPDAKEAKAVRDAFSFTGAGNNPEIIRLLTRAFAPYMEGDHKPAGKPAGQGDKNPATTLYPDQKGLGNAAH